MSTYISKYLSYDEATKSPTAKRLGIENTPTEEQILNMRCVAQEVFDPVREFVNGPLLASSFFRSETLNDLIPGSSKTSQHMANNGAAAIDIDADGYQYGSNLAIFEFIKRKLDFDQLIMEYPDAYGTPAWVHVSKKRIGKNRKEILVKLKNEYIPYAQYKVGMV